MRIVLTLCLLALAGCSVPVADHGPSGLPLTVSSPPSGSRLSDPVALDFLLNVSATPGPNHATTGDNCVTLSVDAQIALTATATWSDETPLAHRMTVTAVDASGRSTNVTSASPARLDLAQNHSGGATLGVLVPDDGAALHQTVHLHLALSLVDAPGETPLPIYVDRHPCPS